MSKQFPKQNNLMKNMVLSAIILASSALMGFAAETTADVSSTGDLLWYDQPAKSWMTQALPLGNGRVGGMFFGGVEKERIQFNEESLWTANRKP